MPKKTTYSRNGAQRGKTKPKSFELVRPVSEDAVLEAGKEDEGEDIEQVNVAELPEEKKQEMEEPRGKRQAGVPSPVPATPSNGSPKSAAARMAARRQTVQKVQRSSANLITAENYSYVRKDLIFILVLAIVMFSAIIILHFVIGG